MIVEYEVSIYFRDNKKISCGMSELAWFVFRKELANLSSVRRVEIKAVGSIKTDTFYRAELELMYG
jgi:hypothetical protein